MKRFGLVVGVLVGLGILMSAVFMANLRKKDKALSPEDKARYRDAELELVVFYNRPFKKSRKIFGELVPFGQLWRTGANEATIFACNENILMNGQKLSSGRYHLITIPYQDRWTVIINSDIPGWGIEKKTGKVYHNPKTDVLVFDTPVIKQSKSYEQFTISFDKEGEKLFLSMRWDSTRVNIPIQKIEED